MGSSALKFLLDSVILIDHLNDLGDATRFIAAQKNDCVLSLVTRAEVLSGLGENKKEIALALLESFPHLPIEKRDADMAAKLRYKERWKLPDAFQAALAINHGLKLVTRNTKDFPPRRHSFVYAPYA